MADALFSTGRPAIRKVNRIAVAAGRQVGIARFARTARRVRLAVDARRKTLDGMARQRDERLARFTRIVTVASVVRTAGEVRREVGL